MDVDSAQKNSNISVGYVLCYDPPNYVRTEVLLAMLAHQKVTTYQAINTRRDLLRYVQTLWRLLVVRIRYNPDVYILGFRGQEIFWPVRLITLGKPLVFDEFLNMHLWIVEEHQLVSPTNIIAASVRCYVKLTLRASQLVLSDTASHAAYSAKLTGTSREKFLPLYVGANELLFRARQQAHDTFTVFYYGSKFLPLHGVETVAHAFALLKNESIKLVIIGGGENSKSSQKFLQLVNELGLNTVVLHKPRVPYEELADHAALADLCLGGPFGTTPQGDLVVTGKTFQFLAMAKPCIIGNNAETEAAGFRNRENCLVVDRANPQALADAIRWAAHNRDKLSDIGQNGRLLYDQHFSTNAQSKILVNALKLLTKN